MRVIDEDANRDRAVTVGKLVAGDLADLNTMIIDWGLVADRREPIGDQGEFPTAHQAVFRRRGFEPRKRTGARCAFAGQHADIRARDDRGQSGDAARGYSRLHHPEFTVGSQKRLRFAPHLRGDDHARAVGGQPDPGHSAELDILVTDRCALRLDAIRGDEADRYRRPALDQRAIAEPAGNNRCDNRNGPHPWQAGPTARRGSGRIIGSGARGIRVAQCRTSAAASHVNRGSKARVAIIVRATTAAKLAIPVPGSTVVSIPNCNSADTIEIMNTSMFDHRPMKSISR